MNTTHTAGIFLALLSLTALLLVGCAPRGRALREVPTVYRRVPPATSAYIESQASSGAKPFSCSFIEFDERGDYLDFGQHTNAYQRIQALSKSGERLMVILYVHGWKNNSHSGDVVEFNNFLRELTNTRFVRDGGFRVHGVYFAWRGNAFRHSLDEASEAFRKTREVFDGNPIVNRSYARRGFLKPLLWIPEQVSYWNRKGAAEDKVSGVSLIRSVYTIGQTVQHYSMKGRENRAFLLGHSFGALMLEQSFAPASLASLTAEWPWENEDMRSKARINPLPFDLTLLVNSAAPSIYAKQYHGAMVAHREALARHKVVGSDAPLVISLTSEADQATATAHKIANTFAPLKPSLWRSYEGKDFILADTNTMEKVPQHYYYQRTPGHNPLLVNHWIVKSEEPVRVAPGNAFQQNIDLKPTGEIPPKTFTTTPRKEGDPRSVWRMTMQPPDPKWSTYKGHAALTGSGQLQSSYWIMRCPEEIMTGHNDIWSRQAMETYAALLAEVERLRKTEPR